MRRSQFGDEVHHLFDLRRVAFKSVLVSGSKRLSRFGKPVVEQRTEINPAVIDYIEAIERVRLQQVVLLKHCLQDETKLWQIT
ncbi:TPA: hypothetical protein EYO57_15235 [Candidatus Poribacteria bacterium]|nr:hypothetical protein [Candidatus Poribacteria bacterium]